VRFPVAIGTLTRDLAPKPVRSTPGLVRGILAFLAAVGEVWTEMQALRREAQRRYPHLEL
jgi:hypothetical protein